MKRIWLVFLMAACAPGAGSNVFNVIAYESLESLEARLGDPTSIRSDGKGGRVITWTRSEVEVESTASSSAFVANPQYGTLPRDNHGGYSPSAEVEVRLTVWADAEGEIYDSRVTNRR